MCRFSLEKTLALCRSSKAEAVSGSGYSMNQSVQQSILVQGEGDCFNCWLARGPEGADLLNIHRENEDEGKGIVIY